MIRELPKFMSMRSSSLGSELLVEFASGAGDENAARDAAFAVLDSLNDACGLATLRAIGALAGIHYFLAICGLGNLCHSILLKRRATAGTEGARQTSILQHGLACRLAGARVTLNQYQQL